MTHDCIVLTGAAGRLGSALRPALALLCKELRLVDKTPVQPAHPHEVAMELNLDDAASVRTALAGCSAVVHFAGYPREAQWDVLLPANIVGVINLWEAAHAQGVQRIIYASSNHAVGMYPRSEIIENKIHPMPDSRYGVTKVFMESMAQLYATKHGVRGFGIRIGHSAPRPSDARMLSHWVHPDDLAALVAIGLQADYESEIVYGVSRNTRSWWNNARAEALGYAPQHSADDYAAELASRTSANAAEEYFQGGSFAAQGFDNERFKPH